MSEELALHRRPQVPAGEPVLVVDDLRVSFRDGDRAIRAVRGLSYELPRGKVLGVVGESGSGKSVSALAVLGLLPTTATVNGSVRLHGRELLGLRDAEVSQVRGRGISMVFQEPMSALTPVYTIGDQVAEAVLVHNDWSKKQAYERAVDLLDLVGIPNAADRAKAFPHEFSGGMRQRVVIAIAIANDPDVIIADEPTTALDVTIQAQVLNVLYTAQQATGAAIVMITHDLGVIAGFADEVLVMYAGRAVERGATDEVYYGPRMPYTMGLLGSIPRADASRGSALITIEGTPPSLAALPPGCPFAPRCPLAVEVCRSVEPALEPIGITGHRAACHRKELVERESLSVTDVFPVPDIGAAPVELIPRDRRTTVLEVDDLVRHYPLLHGAVLKRTVGTVRAVDGVSFDIREGETLGLVGESGCGKSTTLLQILELVKPQSGRIIIMGKDTSQLARAEQRGIRRNMQVVFQDPIASLDPRLPVADILAEPLLAHGHNKRAISARVRELLVLVGLDTDHARQYPQQFSGGQRQRLGIARALALQPKLLVLDEPLSALDVSIRAGIINLLMSLRSRLSLSYLLVAHDLSVIRLLSNRVAVMYLGGIAEIGEVDSVYGRPSHPYSQALLSAIPLPDPVKERARRRILLEGDLPSPANPPSGCRFRTRCQKFAILDEPRRARCIKERPPLYEMAPDHLAACHHAGPLPVI